MNRKGAIRTAYAVVITAIIVGAAVGAGTYFALPRGVSQEDYEALQSDYEALESDYETLLTAKGRYNLDNDTAFHTFLDLHAWLDWWNNAPIIREYIEDPPYTVGYITSWRGNPWQEVNIQEFKREVNRSHLITDYVHMDSAGDVATEIANLEAMFTMWKAGEIDGIIVDPLDPYALVDTIEEIYDAGCPIILFNNAADTTKYNCYVGNDPWTFGTLSAEWLAEELDYEGKVIFLRGLMGYPIDLGRSGGGLATFEKYSGIEVVAIEYGDWSYDKAKTKFMDMATAHPDFDAVYSVGGQMSNAVIDAMLEMDLDPGDYPHASEDQNGFMQKCIANNIPAFASCHPSICCAISVVLMEMLLQGYPVPRMYFYPTPGIPAEKFADYVRPDAPEGVFVFTPLSDETLNEIIG